MRRNIGVALLIIGAAVVAVGATLLLTSDGDEDSSAEPSLTTKVEETTTAAPTTSMVEETTSTTPTPPEDPAMGLARLVIGAHRGTWRNTTFGSSGSIDLEVNVDGQAAEVTVDLGGFVFGAADPPAETVTLDLTADLSQRIVSPLFGEIAADMAPDGVFEVIGTGVPHPGIDQITISGVLDASSITGTYTVVFDDGTAAEGTFEVIIEGADADATPETGATEFIAALEAALRSGDNVFLLERLHPAVTDKYGIEQCRAYVETLVVPDIVLEVISVTGPAAWDFDRDDVTIPIPDALTVLVSNSQLGGEAELHLAEVSGQMRWFTDCGTPLG